MSHVPNNVLITTAVVPVSRPESNPMARAAAARSARQANGGMGFSGNP